MLLIFGFRDAAAEGASVDCQRLRCVNCRGIWDEEVMRRHCEERERFWVRVRVLVVRVQHCRKAVVGADDAMFEEDDKR